MVPYRMNASAPPQHDPPALSAALPSPPRDAPSAPVSRTNAPHDHTPVPAGKASDPVNQLHTVSLRAGIGVGLGSSGVAGSWFVQGDVWFGRFLGIGAEYERAGSTELKFGPRGSDKFSAPRGRLSLRFPVGETWFLVGSAALGYAPVKTNRSYPSQNACGGYECDYSFQNYEIASQHSSALTPAFEFGLRWHSSHGELGLIGRIAFAPPADVVTVGPTFGFGF